MVTKMASGRSMDSSQKITDFVLWIRGIQMEKPLRGVPSNLTSIKITPCLPKNESND